jgi:hypothetical protein
MSDTILTLETPAQNPRVVEDPPEKAGGKPAGGQTDLPGAASAPDEPGKAPAPQPPKGTAVDGKAPSFGLSWLSLSRLDDIDPENVRNSTAFKLGALAGILPALSVMSLTQFLTPGQLSASDGGSGNFSIWSGLLVLLSSAMVGGSVSFFWAENRLRTIFTYGVAGPTVVLSLFLSGISNLAANKRVENVKENSQQEVARATREAQDKATQQANNAVQKIQNTAEMNDQLPPVAPPGLPAAANPDLAAP